MAHPKRKISNSRRNNRRSHDHAEVPTMAVCQTTGETHLYHRAYMHEGSLYYKGKIVIEKKA